MTPPRNKAHRADVARLRRPFLAAAVAVALSACSAERLGPSAASVGRPTLLAASVADLELLTSVIPPVTGRDARAALSPAPAHARPAPVAIDPDELMPPPGRAVSAILRTLPSTTRPATTGPAPFLRGLYTGAAKTEVQSHGKARVVWLEVTAYCPCPICCGSTAHGVTASGKPVTYNQGAFVAADADRYPFGAKLRIPGYHDGQAVEVVDRGSAILGPRVDVFFPTHEEAEAWGRQWLPVVEVGE